MRILVTGFDPFGGETVNPSMEAVKRLPSTVGNAEIISLELSTSFTRGKAVLCDAIDRFRPDCVLNVGQAGGRSAITVEKVAINCASASIADNDGDMPQDMPLDAQGQNAYFASLPIRDMVEAVRAKGIPASISYSAGALVCNSVFYDASRHCEKMGYATKCGFVHIPFIPEQCVNKSNAPSMALETTIEALTAMLETIARS